MRIKVRLQMKNNVETKVLKNECTGCGTCSVRCPKSCISMPENYKDGFLYPYVNENSCIECGICLKTCPVLSRYVKQSCHIVYASRIKDKQILEKSNSGGIFSAIAIKTLKEGGYVCGASFDENLSVNHIIISSLEDLQKLQGSKYVQSNAFGCFREIKNILNEGKKVVFCGTGCQVSGLHNYLVREYDNLLTVELICHGVPSPGLFRKYLEWLSKKSGGKITSFRFRSKHKRPTGEHSEFFYYINDKEYFGRSYEDPFYGSFLQGRTLRQSCYNCNFKGINRTGDITLGDFWGIEKSHGVFPTNLGHNLVMVNSEIGKNVFDSLLESLDCIKLSYEEAIKCNPSVCSSTPLPSKPVNYLSDKLFDNELKPTISFKDRIKNRLPWQVKMMIKKYI